MTILYIDDDDEDREIFKEALSKVAPYNSVLEAQDAKEAMQLLQKTDTLPDYIFLDINLPGIDGISFLREVKKDEKFKTVPVIIYSTSKDKKEVKACTELGAVDFIVKPHTFQGVCNVLKNFF
jgi:CheY-like chemotaxis protein